VVATIPLAAPPLLLAITPNGAFAYVTHATFDNTVTVINTATNTVVANILLPVDATIAAAVTPNGAFVYVTGFQIFTGSSVVAVIDTATNTLVTTVPLPAGSFPQGVAITPNGAFAYVVHSPNIVSVIDTATNTVVASVPVASSGSGIAVNPNGGLCMWRIPLTTPSR
jgi:YVTN family beta-propeller protein